MSGSQTTVTDLRSERNNKKWCLGSFWAPCCVGQLQALSWALGETVSHLDVGQELAGSVNSSFAASGVILAFWHPDGVLLLILVILILPLALPASSLSSSATSLGKSCLAAPRLWVSSSLWQHGRGCGFQLVTAPMSEDVASSKSRIVASYVCLSKPLDLDIPSPLVTSSRLLAASKRAKLGTSCCKQPHAVFHWLDASKFLKVHGWSLLGSASCGTLLRMGSDWAAQVLSRGAYVQVTPTSPVLPESIPIKRRARCFKGKPGSPITREVIPGVTGIECYRHSLWCDLWWRCWVSQPRFWKL